jgi:hypothetical protein
MQFKTNHSPGPFTVQEDSDEHNCLILDAAGNTIAEQWSTSSDVVDAANMNLFKAAPSMLEYMIERAKYISTELSSDKFIFKRYNTLYRKFYEELERILAILKDAGVEIVKEGE